MDKDRREEEEKSKFAYPLLHPAEFGGAYGAELGSTWPSLGTVAQCLRRKVRGEMFHVCTGRIRTGNGFRGNVMHRAVYDFWFS